MSNKVLNMMKPNCMLAIILAIVASTVLSFYLVQYILTSFHKTDLKVEPYLTNITISLNKTTSAYNKEQYGRFYTIKNKTTIQFYVRNDNKNTSFIIFQVHTHNYNITLYNNTKVYGSYVTGTNVGLYSDVTKAKDVFYVTNDNDIDLTMYISVHGYSHQDPIPGAANLEFPVAISPFMQVHYSYNTIDVDAQPSSGMNSELKFYKMDLKENDFSESIYFEGIKKMITYDQILKNGVELHSTIAIKTMRRSLSAYPGLGSVYAAVAVNIKSGVYSVYVPACTYACSPAIKKDCYPYDNPLFHILNVTIIGVGIFVCFFGRLYLKTEIFLSGLLFGVVITYLFIFQALDIYNPVHTGGAALMGVLAGAAWLSFWLFHRKKSISIFLTATHLGLLCSAIIYYRIPSYEPLREDAFFWIMYFCIGILIALIISMDKELSNRLSCAVLGAYATVFALDHYLGSNLKYIVINVLRRATVHGFKNVLLEPPFQWSEVLLTIIWITLSTLGLFWNYIVHTEDNSITSEIPERRNYGTLDDANTRVVSITTLPSDVNEHTNLL